MGTWEKFLQLFDSYDLAKSHYSALELLKVILFLWCFSWNGYRGLGDFTISNSENKTKFSFQIPSTHNTDYLLRLKKLTRKTDHQKYTMTI